MKRLTIISLFLFGLLLMNSCKNSSKNEEKQYAKLVKVATVNEMSSIGQKQFPSVVEETEEVNLSFRVAGPIEKIYVKEGDYVEKGQIVAKMDSRDYEIQVKAAQAQVDQLRSEYKRVAELNKRKSVADNDYEKMKAGKEMAEAKLKNAEDQLTDTKLKAPFSGYITKVNFEEGELVNHGTGIASMVDVSLLKVEINVPASLYVNRDSIVRFECTQEDIPNVVFPLTLYGNNIKANNSGLYKLYLYYSPTTGSQLAPGMNVSVSVVYSTTNQGQVSIPVTAIYTKDNEDYVWILNTDSTVAQRKVVVGSKVCDACINVIDGLETGEQVVVGGLNLLKPGERVRIVKPKSPTNVGDLL